MKLLDKERKKKKDVKKEEEKTDNVDKIKDDPTDLVVSHVFVQFRSIVIQKFF